MNTSSSALEHGRRRQDEWLSVIILLNHRLCFVICIMELGCIFQLIRGPVDGGECLVRVFFNSAISGQIVDRGRDPAQRKNVDGRGNKRVVPLIFGPRYCFQYFIGLVGAYELFQVHGTTLQD